MSRSLRLLTFSLLGASALVAAPLPAQAATSYTITSAGVSISGASLRAGTVQLQATSTSPFDSASFRLDDGVVLATDNTIDAVDGKYVAVVTVDLSSAPSGANHLTTRYVSGKSGSSVTKSISISGGADAGTSALPSGVRGEENTGVPQGVVLREQNGNLEITTAGTVLDGVHLTGCVRVAAVDVKIINSDIDCAAPVGTAAIEVVSGKGYRLQVSDTDINGMGTAEVGVGYGNYTLTRVNVHDTNDGVRLGYSSYVRDSYLHHGVRQGELHPDAAQTTSGTGMEISGSTLDWRNGTDFANSAIMLGSETGSMLVKDALFENNFLDGGNVSVNVKYGINAQNLRVEHNVFGGHTRFSRDVQDPSYVLDLSTNTTAAGTPVLVSRSK